MEIISFVTDNSHNNNSSKFYKKTSGSFNLKSKEHKLGKQKQEVSFAFDYTADARSFAAGKVRRNFSVRNILASIGRGCSELICFIGEHLKATMVTFLVLALVAGSAFGALMFYNYKLNHTGPVVFDSQDSIDEESLNNLMSMFALETGAQIDELGNILDLEMTSADAVVFTEPVSFQNYKVVAGDTISGIAKRFGLSNISTLISVNNIENVRFLGAGQKLKIPSMDGILYTVKAGDSLQSIVDKNKIKMETLLDVNELTSEELSVGQELFLPGVGLDSTTLRNAMGELFKLPIKAKFRWSSPYGKRIDPIKGVESTHTGTDMACPTGTPIYAAMSGTVTYTGTSNVFGKYVIIDHGNGYQTLYAHMSKITSSKGQFVTQSTKIGLVGSTGYSTGPHLHFTVYKNGKLVDPMSVLNKSK